MTGRRVLIAGLGNIFLGDDAFGVELAQRLKQRRLPPGVSVMDFGIRGMDLAFALCDGWDAVILLDASMQGGSPGTLYIMELPVPTDNADGSARAPIGDSHGIQPHRVLGLAAAMGGITREVYLVGCEPCLLDGETPGLSPPVQGALDPAIDAVESLVQRILAVPHPHSLQPNAQPCTNSPSP